MLGVVGVIGSDDLLAAFIAGNSLTWQDFYRVEAEDDTFQDVIDSLLNASVFIYIGTLIPWHAYSNINFQLSPWRLVLLSISILALKRLPWIVAMYRIIPTLHDRPQAIFAGWSVPHINSSKFMLIEMKWAIGSVQLEYQLSITHSFV